MASRERYGSDYEPYTDRQGRGPARFSEQRDSEDHEDERRYPGAFGPSMTDTYERDDRTRRDQPRQHRSNDRDDARGGGDYRGRGRAGWGGHDPRSSYQGADRGEDYGRAGYRQESGGRQAAHDREYARWRQNQMTRFDQDYQEYLAERQNRFNSDFDEWRNKRQSTAATDTGNPMMSSAQKAVEGHSDKTKTRN